MVGPVAIEGLKDALYKLLMYAQSSFLEMITSS